LLSNADKVKTGSNVLKLGIILQNVSYFIFLFMIFWSHFKIKRENAATGREAWWEILWTLYGTSVFICVRIIHLPEKSLCLIIVHRFDPFTALLRQAKAMAVNLHTKVSKSLGRADIHLFHSCSLFVLARHASSHHCNIHICGVVAREEDPHGLNHRFIRVAERELPVDKLNFGLIYGAA
jgi:hypothetical protein